MPAIAAENIVITAVMVVGYLIFTGWLTFYFRAKSSSDFMVAARSVPAVVIGILMMSEFIAPKSTIGVAQEAFVEQLFLPNLPRAHHRLVSAHLAKTESAAHDDCKTAFFNTIGAQRTGACAITQAASATAASTASPSRSTTVSIVTASMMKGGASRTWSPLLPSTVPPAG